MPPPPDYAWKKGDDASRRMWEASDAAVAAALQAGTDAAAAAAAKTTAAAATPLSLAQAYGPDSCVLLTGASGYIGSVILEHLLRFTACPRIVCVVRGRRGASGEERMDRLLARPLYGALHDDGGRLPRATRARVVVVGGDLLAPGLGLARADADAIGAATTHLIHCAASISFTDHVASLLRQNYDAVAAVLALARGCGRLRAFVQVSTAYVNGHRPQGSVVGETLHDLATPDGAPFDHAALAARLRGLDPAGAAALAADYMAASGLPNPYCLTKHMAERLVADAAADAGTAFGVAIVRPAVVGALSQHSPAPGYVGNTSGFASVYMTYALGLVTFTGHKPDSVVDLVPGDMVAGVVVAAGAAAAERAGAARAGGAAPLILHAGNSTTNPVTPLQLLAVHVHGYVKDNKPPFRFALKYPKTNPGAVHRHFLQPGSLQYRARTAVVVAKFAALRGAVAAAGKAALAKKFEDGQRAWLLYEGSAMDFDLKFTAVNTAGLAARLAAAGDAPGMRLVWGSDEAGDDWPGYFRPYFDAINARHFTLPGRRGGKKAGGGAGVGAPPAPAKAAAVAAAAAAAAAPAPQEAEVGRARAAAPPPPPAAAAALKPASPVDRPRSGRGRAGAVYDSVSDVHKLRGVVTGEAQPAVGVVALAVEQ